MHSICIYSFFSFTLNICPQSGHSVALIGTTAKQPSQIFSGGAFTDFDGNKNIGFNYSKTFEDGGRVGYRGGKLVGKALGMFKRQQALERGAGEGFAAAEAYGITGKDISRLFAELARDKTLVGKEKTEYFKILNQALKNPEDFPDEILQIQKKLGIDIGMKSGGLAKILEV